MADRILASDCSIGDDLGFVKVVDRGFYDNHIGWNWTKLRNILLGKNDDDESSDAESFGILFHQMLLQPEKIKNLVVVASAADRRKLEADGNVVVLSREYETMRSMTESVKRHPAYAKGISGISKCEGMIEWMNEYCVECKAMLDIVQYDRDAGCLNIYDVKTCQSPWPWDFSTAVDRYLYAGQAAYYVDGMKKVSGCNNVTFTWIAVQKTPPHNVVSYQASEAILHCGRMLVKVAFKSLLSGVRIDNCVVDDNMWYSKKIISAFEKTLISGGCI